MIKRNKKYINLTKQISDLYLHEEGDLFDYIPTFPYNTINQTKRKVNKYRILDLFSGAGGFSCGLDMLEEFQTVLAVDFMQDALNTFSINFPNTNVILGDITSNDVKINIIEKAQELNVNMIIGGPPCQGFSNKGKKMGLDDPRNFLFKEYLNIVSKLQPDIFVIENVKAMITASNGYFFNEILKEIDTLGYLARYGVLLASDFGVPQQRERTVIIACKNRYIDLPLPKIKDMYKVTVRDAISDLAFLNSGQGKYEQEYKFPPMSKYQILMRKDSHKLFNHISTNHSKIALEKLSMIPPEGDKSFLPKELLGKQKFKTTWGRLKWRTQSPTIDTRFDTPSNGTNSHPELNRSITPREAARIQSFPDTFKFIGSRTNIAKQIGNAVPPLMAKSIGEAIINSQIEKKYKIYNYDAFKLLDILTKSNTFVDHIITDPPYNISQENNFTTMKNAKRKGINFGSWDKNFDLVSWIPKAEKLLKNGGTFIIFTSYRNISFVISEMEKYGLLIKDVLKWIKSNPMPRNINRRYVQDTEYAVWAVKPGKAWIFNKPADKSYLRAEFKTSVVTGKEKTEHPTQKSLNLMRDIINIHTNTNDIVLDPFMGSGSTGVAALQLNRKFIGIELEEKYFKIAQERIKNECR